MLVGGVLEGQGGEAGSPTVWMDGGWTDTEINRGDEDRCTSRTEYRGQAHGQGQTFLMELAGRGRQETDGDKNEAVDSQSHSNMVY